MNTNSFQRRHIGPNENEQRQMLETIKENRDDVQKEIDVEEEEKR